MAGGGYYMIAGRKVLTEYLALGTLTTTGVAAYAFSGKKSQKEAVHTPPGDARSEEVYVRDYLIKKEREEAAKVDA